MFFFEGPWPTMATALSSKAWYSWCSPYLIDVSKKPKDTKCLEKDDMINIGHPLLVVGHNVSYDRARIAEQYDLELPRTRFLDTMALHITVCGMTSSQRKFKLKEKYNTEKKEKSNIEKQNIYDIENDVVIPRWSRRTAYGNSLDACYQFYTKVVTE